MILARCAARLPSWAKLFLTSRPESDILDTLRKFDPVTIEATDPRHEVDLREFSRSKLRENLMDLNDMEQAIDVIIRKSRKLFVYVAVVSEKYFDDDASWDIARLVSSDLPDGLDETYSRYFAMFTNKDQSSGLELDTEGGSNSTIRLLSLLVAALEPLSLSEASQLLGLSIEDTQLQARKIETLFPLRGAEGEEKFFPYHKSVVDWLTDRERSQEQYIDPIEGDQLFATGLLTQIGGRDEPYTNWKLPPPGSYLYAHIFDHLRAVGAFDEIDKLLWRLPWLMAVIKERGVVALKDGIKLQQLGESKESTRFSKLKLLYQTLQLSTASLTRQPDGSEANNLPMQLFARMKGLRDQNKSISGENFELNCQYTS